MKSVILVLISILIGTDVRAAIVDKPVEYRDGKAVLAGSVHYDSQITGKRPGVVVIHDWMGPSDFTRQKAQELAQMGYVALVADIYGKSTRPKDTTEAGAVSGQYKGNRPLLRSRAQAALKTLLKQQQTDPTKVAAIGFCFGGTTVLELARSGAEVTGVVSFHGNLDTPNPSDAQKAKAKILVLHGADDPWVPIEQVAAFKDEMNKAGLDWQLIEYGGEVHAFTNPLAGNDKSKGAAYSPVAAERAWQAMQSFFQEIFK